MTRTRSAFLAYKRQYARERAKAHHFGLTVKQLYAQPHALLVCCGVWQPVTTLPHVCATCGQRYLEVQPCTRSP